MSGSNIAAFAPRGRYAPETPDPAGDTDQLSRLLRDFEAAEEASWDARAWAERARDFYCGKQWTPEEAAILRERRQPLVWDNLIASKIDLLCGMERRGRSDPRAYPREPTEEQRADVATQVLRYISDDNRYDVIRSNVYQSMLIEGFGGADVTVEPDPTSDPSQPSYNVLIQHVGWDRLFYDPHSSHPGFQDARYKGVVIWMDWDEAIEQYPGCESILENTYSEDTFRTYADKPRWFTGWTDTRRTRVRVVQMHYKRGPDWWQATFTRGGFLEKPMKSPYLDRRGNAASSLIMWSAKIDRDNNRFGIVHDMIPRQEEINKRRSRLLHALSVKQVKVEQGAVDDVDELRKQVAKPDGVILFNPGAEVEIITDTGGIEGQFKLLEYTVQQMNVAGPNAAMAGKDPREQSGRAIIAQQAGGQMENEPLADALRQFTHKIFEAAWLRARQFWTAQKMIRVTDSDKNVQFIGLNTPVTLAEELSRMDPAQAAATARQMGLAPNDPRLQQVVRVENSIDDLDVDITVEEGPDTPNLEFDSYQAFLQLPSPTLAQFPPEFFVQMNPGLRNKDQMLAILKDHQAQQAQAQQAQQALAQQEAQAKLALAQATAADKIAQAHDRQAQTVDRLHGWAMDHAAATQGVGVQGPAMPTQQGMGP